MGCIRCTREVHVECILDVHAVHVKCIQDVNEMPVECYIVEGLLFQQNPTAVEGSGGECITHKSPR